MSIEVYSYPDYGTKQQFIDLLISLGYDRTDRSFMFIDSPELTHFGWFDNVDFRSISGVTATIIPGKLGDEEAKEWMIHTRTNISASYYDQQKQDETARTIRRTFGGHFYNDHRGRNRYINPDPDPRTPIGRGIYLTYANISQKIDVLIGSLPKSTLPDYANSDDPIVKIILQHEPVRVIYNALTVFAVASLESFFSESFKIMLKYDRNAKSILRKENRKIDITDVIDITLDETSIEQLVSSWYSFQSLGSINRAFSRYFNIDIYKVLSARKKISSRIQPLHKHYSDLVERRHDFVHRFDFNNDLDHDGTQELLRLVKIVMATFIAFMEERKGILIHSIEYGLGTDTDP